MYNFKNVSAATEPSVQNSEHLTLGVGGSSSTKGGKKSAGGGGRKNYVKGSQKRYRVGAENSEQFLHGNSPIPPSLPNDPLPTTDNTSVQNSELLAGIDLNDIAVVVPSTPSLYKARTRKEKVEVPVNDKNFAENFPIETPADLDIDGDSHNDLSKPSFVGIDLSELDRELVRARAELCKKDFAFFIKEFWDVIDTAKLKWNWHMNFLAGELQQVAFNIANRRQKTEDIIVNVPPGSSKTNIITKLFPVYCWVVDPTITFITSTYERDLANRQANTSRDLLKSDKFKAYFPHIVMKESQDNKQDYENRNGGWRYSTSVGAAVTGRHCLISICDDPQNPEEAASEVERKNANEWISGTLSSRMADKDVTVFIYVQQRLHVNDVTGFLLGQGLPYKHICLPAEVNKRVKPLSVIPMYGESGILDPNRISAAVLQREKVRLGTKVYQTQYNQSPNDEENAIIKEGWFQKVSQLEFDELFKANKPPIDFYLDTAFTKKTNRDPSAILACCKIKNDLYITAVKAVRYEFPRLIQHIKDWTAAQGYSSRSKIIIEPKANGISIIQQLKTDTALNVIQGKDSKADKIVRLNAISPIVEARRVFLLDGPWNREFLEEVTADEPVHDDIRDCFVAAIENKMTKPTGHGSYAFKFL